MRWDARIAVHVLPAGEPPELAPDAKAAAVLIRIGTEGAGKGDQAGATGWASVLDLPDRSMLSHAAGCRCCSGRSEFSDALGTLFASRARMQLPFFTRVVVQLAPDRIHDLVTILCEDSSVAGRFRRES